MTSEIAERYAEGYYQLAVESDTLREKKEQCEKIQAACSEYPDINALLRAVKVTKEEKKNFLQEVFGGITDTDTLHMLKLLVDKNRIFYMPQILSAFLEKANEGLGILHVTVESARELKEEDLARIQSALGKKYKKEIVLNTKLDPELIAGIKVVIGNNVTDITAKNQIEEMRKAILRGGRA